MVLCLAQIPQKMSVADHYTTKTVVVFILWRGESRNLALKLRLVSFQFFLGV